MKYYTYTNDNTMSQEDKLCLCCQKPIHGRADKKFCDDYCRNTHNNQQKARINNYIRRINRALLKNRKILERLLPETKETVKIHEDELLALGFQFRYNTHLYTNEKGRQYRFCYEYGYLVKANKWYLIVRKNDNYLIH